MATRETELRSSIENVDVARAGEDAKSRLSAAAFSN